MESPTGPKVPLKITADLLSQEDLPVDHRGQVNLEPNSLGPGSNFPLKGDRNINEPVSMDSVKKEQQITKKKMLRSFRNFPNELL